LQLDTWAGALLVALLGVAPGLAAASAPQPIDCPLRHEPYSIDSPLIDLLLKPEAKAVVEREMPQLLLEWAIAWAAGTGETDCRAGISAAPRAGQ
jgi:hypothetical protein